VFYILYLFKTHVFSCIVYARVFSYQRAEEPIGVVLFTEGITTLPFAIFLRLAGFTALYKILSH
jgi:hypothetical protein